MNQSSEDDRGPSANAFGVTLIDTAAVRTGGLFVLIARAANTETTTLYYNVSKPTLTGDTGRGNWSDWYRFEFPEHVPSAPSNKRHDKESPSAELRVAGMDLITVTKAAGIASPADAPFRVVALAETLYCFRPAKDGTLYLNRLRILEQRSSDSDGVEQAPGREEGSATYEMEQVWEPRFRASGEKDVPASARDSQSVFSPDGPPFVEPTIQLTAEISIGKGGFDVAVVPTSNPKINRIYIASIVSESNDLSKQVVKLWHLTDHEAGQFDVSELGASTVIAPTMVYGAGTKVALTPLSELAPALAFYYEQDSPIATAAATPGDGATSLQDGRLALALPVAHESLGLKRAMAMYDFAIKADGTIPASFDRPALLVDGSLSDGKFIPDMTSGGFPTRGQSRETIHVDEGLVVSAMVLGQVQPHRSPLLLVGSDGLLHLYFGGPAAEKSQIEGQWGGLVPGQPRFQVAQYNTRSQRLVIDLNWRDTARSEQARGTVRCLARLAGPMMNETTVSITPYTTADALNGAGNQPDLCTVTIDYGKSAVDMPTETWRGVPRELRAFLRVMNGEALELAGDPRVKIGRSTFFDPSGTCYQVRIATDLSPSGDTPGGPGQPPYPASLTLVSRRTDLRLRSATVSGISKDTATLVLRVGSDAENFTVTFAEVPRQITDLPDILNGSDARYRYAANPADPPVTRLVTWSQHGQDAILFYPIQGQAPDSTSLRIVVEPNAIDLGLCTAKFTRGEITLELKDIPRSQAGFIAAVKQHTDWAKLRFAMSPGPLPGNVEDQRADGPMALSAATMLFDALLPVEGLNAKIQNGEHGAILQKRHLSAKPPLAAESERGMLGLYALLGTVPESGGDQYLELTSGPPLRPAVDGSTSIWQRREPTYQLSFNGSNRMNVPIESQGQPTASSSNLAPGMDWTLEAWVRPLVGDTSVLATFHAATASSVPGEPTPDFALATAGSRSLQFGAIKQSPPDRRSTFLLTGFHRTLMLDTSFTWEFWVQPQPDPAPSSNGAPLEPLGYALMIVNENETEPNFGVGLNHDRRVVVRYMSSAHTLEGLTSNGVVTSESGEGEPVWTHVAVVVVRPPATDLLMASMSIIINGVIDKTAQVPLGQFSGQVPQAHIGGVGSDDASLAGLLAAMRFWSTPRSLQQIRTSAFQNVRPDEQGLSGLWSLDADKKEGADIVFRNLATSTYPDLNAIVMSSANQDWKLVPNRFLLSFAAGVAGAPIEIGSMVLRTNRWNHIAVVYRAGGGLRLLSSSQDEATADYNYAIEESPTTFGLIDRCAIDAWIQLSPSSAGTDNTIIARWSREEGGREFELFVDSSGAFAARFVIIEDLAGKPGIVEGSGGAQHLAAKNGVYPVCHVAAVLELTNKTDTDKEITTGTWHLELRIDNIEVFNETSDPIKGQTTRLQIRSSQTPLTVGMRKPPLQPWESLSDGDGGFFKGVIGETRVWSNKPSWEHLFPERFKHLPPVVAPVGLIASWAFREQQGIIAYDSVRDDNLRLSSSDLWTQLRVTSTQELYANGIRIWNTEPATGLNYSTQNQFSLGQRLEGGQGLVGAMTDVRIWREARTPSQLSENLYGRLKGDEPNLTAYWSFDDKSGRDQTGGGNNASPEPEADRFKLSDAPISNEGPEVFNTYGGVVTDFQVTTDIRPAVGELVAATVDRDGVAVGKMRRQYVYENPVASLPLPFKVGDLALTFIGQVQTDAKLIGYFEGAPPVPSENLTLPPYDSPTKYNGTSQVKLIETAETSLTYASGAETTSNIATKGSVGPFWKYTKGTVIGIGVGFALQDFEVQGQFVVSTSHEFKWGTGVDNTYASSWTDRATDSLDLTGAWEAEDEAVLNPTVGRRFVPDNNGSALVESLVADSFAIRNARSGAMLGVILIPNLAIPPDRNIIIFPIKNDYTKQGTLDGKVGFKDDPSYQGADRARGSYFKPAEAYRLRGEIEQSAARDHAFFRQFDAEGRGKTEFTANLKGVTGNLPVDFAADTVRRGLVNSYVWSADGGFHAEEQSFLARVSNTYKGFFNRVDQGGFDLENTFAFFVGMKGALSFSGGLQVAVNVSAADQQTLAFGLDATVVGERYLHAWSNAKYTREPTPGKVKTYRFMTFYEPPSENNAGNFRSVIDPVWLSRSTDAAAVVLRSADLSNPAWRVFHRVTYVERVPPQGSDQPVYSEPNSVRAPVNLMGNIALLGLVMAELGAGSPTPAQIGRALQRVLNPPPDVGGKYPKAIIEKFVPWWGALLEKARPGAQHNQEAAKLLGRIFTNALVYVRNGYATGAISGSLKLTLATQSRFVNE